jgi:ABC-type multidrug transport system permease subunit
MKGAVVKERIIDCLGRACHRAREMVNNVGDSGEDEEEDIVSISRLDSGTSQSSSLLPMVLVVTVAYVIISVTICLLIRQFFDQRRCTHISRTQVNIIGITITINIIITMMITTLFIEM